MQSKLEFICDRIIEAGWLAAIVFTPLYFNVYSSRVFEPDKISLLRNIVLMMTIAWLIKLVEGYLRRPASTRRPADVAAEATPGWLPSLLRIPMMVPILVYAAVYLLSTLTSIVPLTSIFGSYQRLQGTITQYTYITLALLILANMRSRVQLERLITFGIVTSVPVAAYGIVQALGMDPLPWAGDVQTRVASSMGNAIFVAAWLIMAVPLTLQRWIAAVADRNTAGTEAPPAPAEPRSDPWPLAIIGSAAVFFLVIVQYLGITTGNDLPVAAGVPQLTPNYNTFGDVFLWILVIAVGALFVWLVNNIADQALRNAGRGGAASEPGPPAWLSIANPVIQLAVLGLGIYIVGKVRVPDFSLWIVLPAAIFIFYALSFLYTLAGNTSVLSNRLQLYGLPVLMVMQILVIFLTQSRGPELGLLLGLVIFAFAFLLRRHLYRAFAVSLAVVLLFGAFLLVFNLPDSPIASWRSLPYIGRLGLISQTDVERGAVDVAVDGNAGDAHFSAGAKDADGDFTAIGDEDLAKHGALRRNRGKLGK